MKRLYKVKISNIICTVFSCCVQDIIPAKHGSRSAATVMKRKLIISI